MRQSGLILHPTSLPGSGGIGALGQAAQNFVDFLASAKQQLWQILPLGPTDFGNSPYMTISAFAGNPLLIDLEALRDQGWLPADELVDIPPAGPRVDFEAVIPFKARCLAKAFLGFQEKATAAERAEVQSFRQAQGHWLEDFALFVALRETREEKSWNQWPMPLRMREAAALAEAKAALRDTIDRVVFEQFVFAQQWQALRRYANDKGVKIIGDVPIFVAYNSVDVWANREIFRLDAEGHPTHVAGVPPDYFSPTGQLWGNPLYRWDVLAQRGYDWWVQRFATTFAQVDMVRIDHFRGFEAFWEVAADAPNAIKGRWVKGPGMALFDTLRQELGALPVIAEDLGVITPEVEALRDATGFPGMKVLHFAFGGDPNDVHLPHRHTHNTVVYPGTHDNDTTQGWYTKLDSKTADRVRLYFNIDGHDIGWQMLTAAWASVADRALAPVQDLLSLGSEARMNTPGEAKGNWGWRLLYWQLNPEMALRLRRITERYGRALPEEAEAKKSDANDAAVSPLD